MTDREELIEEAAEAFGGLTSPTYGAAPGWERAEVYEGVTRVLAVFEKAHTPTDDEREALARIVKDIAIKWGGPSMAEFADTPPIRKHYATADAILAAGFRRSEVPEPSADEQECDQCGEVFSEHSCKPIPSCIHLPASVGGRLAQGEALLDELSAWQKHTGDTALANLLRRAAVQFAAMTAEKEKWRIRCAEETIAWADEATENRQLLTAEPQGEPSNAQVNAFIRAINAEGSVLRGEVVRIGLRAAGGVR